MDNLHIATNLEEMHRTLTPRPLKTPDEMRLFYIESLNKVRGGVKTDRMMRGMIRSYNEASHYKAALGGHSGAGKTTELAHLISRHEVAARLQPLWFSALSDIDPGGFKPFDVVLVMMIRLVEETAKPLSEGGVVGKRIQDSLLEDLTRWFASGSTKFTEGTSVAVSVEAGGGVKSETLWATVTGLFFNAKGEAKYTSDRKTEVVEYRLTQIFRLIDLANRVLDECNRLLKEATKSVEYPLGREWLFIGDDFEKAGISPERTEDLFVHYGNVFKDLRTHLLFTVPVSLVYSDRSVSLPFEKACVHIIPDTPVFDQQHKVHSAGREALREVVCARVGESLFANGQLDRLLAASGGNLRDLFALIVQSADEALDRGEPEAGSIQSDDVTKAINSLRISYERALGESPDDRAEKITYEMKAERLKQVYDGKGDAKIADSVLHSLLRSRAVQEFNGEGWFGVHPLVVSILHRQGRIQATSNGTVPGAAV